MLPVRYTGLYETRVDRQLRPILKVQSGWSSEVAALGVIKAGNGDIREPEHRLRAGSDAYLQHALLDVHEEPNPLRLLYLPMLAGSDHRSGQLEQPESGPEIGA